MGRWAQRSRGGGGINALNFIVEARQTAGDQLTITYNAAVAAARFSPPTFKSKPSDEVAFSIVQFSTRQVVAIFPVVTSGDTSLEYTGAVKGIVTPQTVPITP